MLHLLGSVGIRKLVLPCGYTAGEWTKFVPEDPLKPPPPTPHRPMGPGMVLRFRKQS